jgi:hypothetical protein
MQQPPFPEYEHHADLQLWPEPKENHITLLTAYKF